MPSEATPDERTEPATPKRRQEFRERGEIVKSRELASVAILFASMGALYFGGPIAGQRIARATAFRLNEVAVPDLTISGVQRILIQQATVMVDVLLPFVGLLLVVGVFSHVAQSGWLFAGKALEPKPERINPIGKFKEVLFSSRTAFEGVKTSLKLTVVGIPIYLAVREEIERAPALLGADPLQVVTAAGLGVVNICAKIAGLLLVIALFDYGYQYWSFERRMKMTLQEVKQEMKEGEGDPHVRARRRRIAQEMSMNRMMSQVPTADVIVTNPTHYAVALKYDKDGGAAPRVVAKGKDLIAARIRELATANGVPLVENRPLAQALHKSVKLGREIPPALYRAVAEVLAMVYRQQGRGPEAVAA